MSPVRMSTCTGLSDVTCAPTSDTAVDEQALSLGEGLDGLEEAVGVLVDLDVRTSLAGEGMYRLEYSNICASVASGMSTPMGSPVVGAPVARVEDLHRAGEQRVRSRCPAGLGDGDRLRGGDLVAPVEVDREHVRRVEGVVQDHDRAGVEQVAREAGARRSTGHRRPRSAFRRRCPGWRRGSPGSRCRRRSRSPTGRSRRWCRRRRPRARCTW